MSSCVRAGLVLAMALASGNAKAEPTGTAGATGTATPSTAAPQVLPQAVVPRPARARAAQLAPALNAQSTAGSAAAPLAVEPAPSSAPAAAGKPAPAIPEPVKVSSDPRPTLTPETFVATMRAAERYRQIAAEGGWPDIPTGITLKAGDKGAAVATLKRRLAVTGDLAPDAAGGEVFDAALTEAVKRFQARHGLPESGLVLARTIAAMNVPAETRARELANSAGRLIGSKFPFGERYVAVNIPSATVEAVQNGAVARRYVAVVGKPDRPSPTVETRITTINFNPTWTVPVSLIKKDIIPHVRKDPGYLAKMHIRLLDAAGNDVDPARIDWATQQAVNYTVRQDPGSANSLGEVRIDMPNRHAVYMHDTPSKRLFARNVRFESSGCVRVSGVRDLVAWLLEGTPVQAPANPASAGEVPSQPPATGQSWTAADVDAAIASGRRFDVKLPKSVPVAWVYLTGYALSDGTVNFRDDPYGLDAASPAPDAPAVAQQAPPTNTQAAPTIDTLITGSIGHRN